MDALHPRLLVGDFGASFRFYAAVLPELVGAELARGSAEGPYASWDVGGEGVLALFDRAGMGGAGDSGGGGGGVMLVSRVADVDAGYGLCLRHGAVGVAEPADRPEWGPGLRVAHLRDPEGNLWELQAY
ncbi:glyoxalase [Kitasatospora sp. MMS16-BH015]|uniref:VOC family protein n=1 Tax=Kitasatospora sp. MMS16-BH015 TaxID=2018025 RepID=UPI000CA3EAC6|nr:VOC family protein [Kitasatospora sp. MMS16-BH015]AUG81455.1 glyoxalase [Kitasatospora sp. MMS16-BH015]